MNGRRIWADIRVILIAGLGTSLVLALIYLGPIDSFTVTAESANETASPIAVVVSRLLFAAITVSSFALLGWFCHRFLKRRIAKNKDSRPL